jgi:hypothetical protein
MGKEAEAVGKFVREAGAALPQAMEYIRNPNARPEVLNRTDMEEAA